MSESYLRLPSKTITRPITFMSSGLCFISTKILTACTKGMTLSSQWNMVPYNVKLCNTPLSLSALLPLLPPSLSLSLSLSLPPRSLQSLLHTNYLHSTDVLHAHSNLVTVSKQHLHRNTARDFPDVVVGRRDNLALQQVFPQITVFNQLGHNAK